MMTPLEEVRRDLRANRRQWEAFTRSGDTLVVAPPGSGKTKLLTAKLGQDFLTGLLAPYGAACITYSNAAADELDLRLQALHVERRANLFVGTVHSFALHAIIVPYGSMTGFTHVTQARVASRAEQKHFVDQAVAEIYQGEPSWGVENSMRVRRRYFMDQEEADVGGDRIARVEHRYENQLSENALIDFDDMVRVAVEIVEGNEWVRRVLAARFSKLYIDEYQDLGPGLHRLVESLCFDQDADSTLFAVADPDQCIYDFAGADPELLKTISGRSSVETVRLLRNYRSGDRITRNAATALDHELEVESDRTGGVVQIHRVEGWIEGQAKDAAERVAVAHDGEGVAYEKITVLAARNHDCLEAAEVFRNAGLPVFVRRADEYPRTPATLLIEGLAAWSSSPLGESGFSLAELLQRWKRLRGDFRSPPPVDLLTVVLDFRERLNEPASALICGLVNLGLLERLYERQETQEDAHALEQMQSDFTEGSLSAVSVAGLGDRALARNRVHILTMHGSKGLEFDRVFLLGLDAGKFPGFWAKGQELVQNRRQFYVSITRARDEVHLYYTGWHRNQYGRVFRDGPSPFITDLAKAY